MAQDDKTTTGAAELPEALRLAAQAVKAWSNIDDFWELPDSDCGETVLGAIEEGEKYALLTIDADTFGTDGESVKLARFYASANPGAVLALLDERDHLHAQVEALSAAQAGVPAEPLHITHGPLMRHAAHLLRSRKPALPEHESVAAELETAADGHPTPSGEPSAEWLALAEWAIGGAAEPPQPSPSPAPAEAVERIVHLRAAREKHVYVAGPMTGLPEFNFPLFNATAARLRSDGWHVENPAEHGHVEGAGWADYLRWDISRIATCGAVYLLPGWSKSKGASLEVHIAQVLGLRVLLADGAEPPQASPAPAQPGQEVDLIARGMHWKECETLMKEACAQEGVQWDDEKEPQSIAINVMMRLANAAHKAGFTLGKERMAAAARAAPQPATADAAPSEWDVRGQLAASLTFWHRLKDKEDDELVELFQRWSAPSAEADAVLAYLDALQDDAAVHIFPSDLRRCATSECTATVYSVRVGSPDGKTVPLFSREQVAAALAAQREVKPS